MVTHARYQGMVDKYIGNTGFFIAPFKQLYTIKYDVTILFIFARGVDKAINNKKIMLMI